MYSIIIDAEVIESKKNEFLQSCEDILNNLIRVDSNYNYIIEQNLHNKNKFCLQAKFDSQLSLDEHLKSDAFKVLHGAIKLLCTEFQINAYSQTEKYSTEKIQNIINKIH